MPEGRSTAEAALKTAERTEDAARRDEPSAKVVQEERKSRGHSPGAAERAEATVVGGYEELATLNRASIHATLQAGEAMLRATSSLAEELTSFACKRLGADVETGCLAQGRLRRFRDELGDGAFAASRFEQDIAEAGSAHALGPVVQPL